MQMKKKFRLSHPTQCKTCPWLKGSKLLDIPNYSEHQHRTLQCTIADGTANVMDLYRDDMYIMSCHYSTESEPRECIGWLINQLCAGNNIQLRFYMTGCENTRDIQLAGEQKSSFEETFLEG